jgi:hypothetical protein
MSKKNQTSTQEINLDEIIVGGKYEKYEKLVLAMRWVYHLKGLEENKNKPTPQLIEQALADVLTGRVTLKDIEKAEEKDEEARIKQAEEKKKEKAQKKNK